MGTRTTGTWYRQVAIVAVLLVGMLYSALFKTGLVSMIAEYTKLTETVPACMLLTVDGQYHPFRSAEQAFHSGGRRTELREDREAATQQISCYVKFPAVSILIQITMMKPNDRRVPMGTCTTGTWYNQVAS